MTDMRNDFMTDTQGIIRPIDVRSDTVTRPTRAMREAMIDAEVGDDVFAEDPDVNRLQDMVAEMLGKERGLFVPSGVMSNQLCLNGLTRPGDEVIVGKDSHIFNYETAAPALLSGVQLNTIEEERGCLPIDEVVGAIREGVYYLPRTSVIAQEQTHNRHSGAIVPLEHMQALCAVARERGIASHLDGARLWNAITATGISAAEYAATFDTVSVCLSKGLGAPIGSVLVGPKELVERARTFRKAWGGGWRQAGILAAACIYAIENHLPRLREDHEKARIFQEGLRDLGDVVRTDVPETNIVLLVPITIGVQTLKGALAERGLLLSDPFPGALRAVFHLDVTIEDARRAGAVAAEVIEELAETTRLET